ncbi:MAG: MraZ N-terminal domain-containing protein, partial [Oscillospiraceae bacterium]
MYFSGTFSHTLDTKKRLFIPAKFREGLGETFVLW